MAIEKREGFIVIGLAYQPPQGTCCGAVFHVGPQPAVPEPDFASARVELNRIIAQRLSAERLVVDRLIAEGEAAHLEREHGD